MLVLYRRRGERIELRTLSQIPPDTVIEIEVLETTPSHCRIGIDAPRSVFISREDEKPPHHPRLTTDSQANCSYLYLRTIEPKGVRETRHSHPAVQLDFDADGKLVGIEILDNEILPP